MLVCSPRPQGTRRSRQRRWKIATEGKERKSEKTGQREEKRRKRQRERAEARTRKATAAAGKEGGEAARS